MSKFVKLDNKIINIDKIVYLRLDLMPVDTPWPNSIFIELPKTSFSVSFKNQDEAKKCFDDIYNQMDL